MISYRYGCIFIHVPRTGGSSIENAIWGPDISIRTARDLWGGFVTPHRNKYQTDGLQHLQARHVQQEVGTDVFTSFFTFSFVRNPWDKLVSNYHLLRYRPDILQFMGLRSYPSFPAYVERIAQVEHVHWAPQHAFITDADGSIAVDFVGRFEQLREDAANVFKRIGLRDTSLPHASKTSHGPYQEYYNPETEARVAELYAEDIRRFGYGFDVEARLQGRG